MPEKHGIRVRYMMLLDCDAVHEFEYQTLGGNCGTQRELEDFIGRQGNAGIVAVNSDHQPLGFMLYTTRLKKATVRIRRIVSPSIIIAGQLLIKLMDGIPSSSPVNVEICVWERNTVLQQFLSRRGFKAVQTLPKRFGEDDGYLFQFKQPSPCQDDALTT